MTNHKNWKTKTLNSYCKILQKYVVIKDFLIGRLITSEQLECERAVRDNENLRCSTTNEICPIYLRHSTSPQQDRGY